jgi:histidyl-tRNA synthetase
MSLSTKSYKGTRDYYPEDKQAQNYIFDVWRRIVERYGYQEYGAPTLEPLEIYTAKSGQELANEQTYTFEDRGGRQVAIRPEMTPTISRMVAARRQELAYPARLYSIANFMRYERPQKGREREFWQLNVDLFGVNNEQADIEVIMTADAILKAFNAKENDYVIRINNRQFISDVMGRYLGLGEDETRLAMKLLDRKDKITADEFNEQAAEIVSDKLEDFQAIVSSASANELPQEVKEYESFAALSDVLSSLEKSGITSARFDITLMRGLDYYTGTVFEVFDTNPDNRRALFGGGRYDGLVGLFGVEPVSAVGFAIGLTTFEDFLKVRGGIPEYFSGILANIMVLDGGEQAAAELASKLRAVEIPTAVDFSKRKADKLLKTAMKKDSPYLIFVGENEAKTGTYKLINRVDGSEQEIDLASLITTIKKFSVREDLKYLYPNSKWY